MEKARQWLSDFFFPAESTQWLAILRWGLGLQVLLYTLSLRNDWSHLFGANDRGLISRELSEAILSVESPLAPRLGWIVEVGNYLGLSEEKGLIITWILLLLAGSLLLCGFFSRFAAILAWFLHLCAVKSGGLLSYGVDNFTTIGLFYLMLSPLPDRYSLDWRIRKSAPTDPRLHGLFRRVLQLHMCLIYFFGGLAKCFGAGWWDGVSIWRALTRPPFDALPATTLVKWRDLLPFIGIFICLVETGYPFFIWSKRTRLIWLALIIGMHVGIGLTMGMYLFALIMIVLNLAAFGPPMSFLSNRAFRKRDGAPQIAPTL